MTALVHDPAVLNDPDLSETVLTAVRFVIEKESLRGEIKARSTDAAMLPTGFLTFLLTDIEGSTALLRRLEDGYAQLLKDVRDLIRDAVLQAGGREVDVRADEFFAVFEVVEASIAAALVIQRAMSGRTWQEDLDVRVRAGIHSGRPTLTETGYIGMSVHTAARVCSVARGGQIVVSGETMAAAEGSLPAGVGLRSLGRHRLPGLTHAEALFQVEAEGLPADFPPIRIAPEGIEEADGPLRAPPTGLEPVLPAPEADALSAELRGPNGSESNNPPRSARPPVKRLPAQSAGNPGVSSVTCPAGRDHPAFC